MSATSSNHSKILAIHEASRECLWLRSVTQHIRKLCGISLGHESLTVVHEDNSTCIALLKDEYIKGDKTKHILPKFLFTLGLFGVNHKMTNPVPAPPTDPPNTQDGLAMGGSYVLTLKARIAYSEMKLRHPEAMMKNMLWPENVDRRTKTNDETCLMAQSSNEVCLRTCLKLDEWIKDSGCPKHMTDNKSLFSTYKAYNGEHVDNLAFNLLSVGQTCDKKCQVLFTKEGSEIIKDGKS
ncbi:hypothetical protein Tco_0598863 [Tanacetum coccineum]